MFRLKQKEWDSMSSHFVMTYPPKRPKIALPYAFTEHGVTMMASVLRSDTAVKMNIAIVRAFIALRKFAGQYGEMLGQLKELKDRVGNHDEQLNEIYNAIENLLDEKAGQKKLEERIRIGYKVNTSK